MPRSPFEFFLQKARVAPGDNAIYGPGGEGFVRLTFGCLRATLVEALERCEEGADILATRMPWQ